MDSITVRCCSLLSHFTCGIFPHGLICSSDWKNKDRAAATAAAATATAAAATAAAATATAAAATATVARCPALETQRLCFCFPSCFAFLPSSFVCLALLPFNLDPPLFFFFFSRLLVSVHHHPLSPHFLFPPLLHAASLFLLSNLTAGSFRF